MSVPLLILVAIGTVCLSGCTSGRCKTDNDCFAPEVCVARQCELPLEGFGQDVELDEGDVGAPDGGMVDEDPRADMHVERDLDPQPDLGADDMSPDFGPADMTAPGCEIDPFTFMCSEDPYEPNNTLAAAELLSTEAFGCPLDDFEPFDTTLDGTVCPVDGSDWYQFTYVDCFDAAFIIEFQVELLSDCDPDVVGLSSSRFDCADDLVECTIEDGKPTLRAIVESQPRGSVRSAYVEVHNKMQQDIRFDYRLWAEVRR